MSTLGSFPIPQRHRPIGFALVNGGMYVWAHAFFIRPEELVYTKPVRASVMQTFGGHFLDDFGEGLPQITIQGHTGWRGAMLIPGELEFYNLRELIVDRFHELRADRVKAGQDPDQVQLVFLDTLNILAYVVHLEQFRLRRHKSRPLLYQYDIRMTALEPW